MCVPGVLAPFHWTTSSPVLGLDSRLRSVGGDRAGGEEEKEESEEEKAKRQRGMGRAKQKPWIKQKEQDHKVSNFLFILTCHNTPCDWRSLLVAVYDWLDAVGVLNSRSQTGNVDTPRVRGHISGGFSTLTGTYRQLQEQFTQSQREMD